MRRRTPSGSDAELRRATRRIGLQTAALVMALLVVVGVVLYGLVVRGQNEQMTSSLNDAITRVGMGRGQDRDNDTSGSRGNIQYVVLDPRGLRTSADVPPGLPDLEVMRTVASTHVTDRRTVHLEAGGFEVLTTQRGDDTVQLIASTYEQHQERERIVGALALAGGTGLVLASLAAAVLARRAVQPITQALEQQRRFVADAGHELRTPLTSLRTNIDLLTQAGTQLPEAARDELLDDVRAQLEELTTLVGDLVELARDDQDPTGLHAEVAGACAETGTGQPGELVGPPAHLPAGERVDG